jgi:hypothetical protein
MRRDVLIPYRLWFVFPVPAAYFGESRMLKLGWRAWLRNQRQRHLLRLQLQAAAEGAPAKQMSGNAIKIMVCN